MLSNCVVSQSVSYATCGMRTGCEAGQGPAGEKASLAVLYMWSWWLGESTSLPFQQLRGGVSCEVVGGDEGGRYEGKWWTVMMPPLHDLVGKSGSSGKRVPLSWSQTKRRPTCFFAASTVLVVGLPTVMRKPWSC
jgi:hypothetical protein